MTIFNSLMTHTVTLYKLSRDWQGEQQIEGTFADLPAFVEWTRHWTTSQNDEKVMCEAIVYMQDDAPIDPDYPYWAIEQTAPMAREKRLVQKVDPIDDPRTGKTHHYEIEVK